jgi:2-keto-4-pentenoate hydratase/2-oxohepta-3-ene-1,7-dioic acid hydratase in catechol pathway
MTKKPFALGTFTADDDPFAALVMGDRVAVLAPHLGSGATVRTLLSAWGESLEPLQDLADGLRADDFDYELASLRALPPVDPPGQLFQAGANYRQHLVELTKAGPDRMHRTLTEEERERTLESIDERARAGTPYIFLGLPHSIIGAGDDIVLPDLVKSVDWELELAVVIGWTAHQVPREEALDVVAGYTICNDITARDRIFRADLPGIGTDWLAGKNWPTFFPTGPLLVPAVHVSDPMSLHITLSLNGEVMQDSSTSDMMFDIGRLIEHASSIAELRPGDMLLTGSPAGNGVHHGRFLAPGDVLTGEIAGLGRQRNRCVAEATLRFGAGGEEEQVHA